MLERIQLSTSYSLGISQNSRVILGVFSYPRVIRWVLVKILVLCSSVLSYPQVIRRVLVKFLDLPSSIFSYPQVIRRVLVKILEL